MAMNMSRAISARMITRMHKHTVATGSYNEYNEWVEGANSRISIAGVFVTGNKFSQFDKGVALIATEGGERYSDFRTLTLKSSRYSLLKTDKVEYKGQYYNILQMSDELEFGFRTFLLELSKTWSP
jgi:hypothetical protein